MAYCDEMQLNTFRSYVTMLGDFNAKEEIKLKAAQELSEHFEVIIQSSAYPSFLEHSLKVFMRILQDTEPQFIQENTIQHIRKLILEMIHRLPISENLRQHVKPIISLMLKILRIDNEENVLVSLRIIIELHKHFRPSFNQEVQHFLSFVKEIYISLPNHVTKIFEPTQQLRVKDLKEVNIEVLLAETYSTKPIHIENHNDSNTFAHVYNLLPRGILSLKVLQELPIIVVLMYQIYKNAVHQEVSEFIPLIMTTINLQPTIAQKNAPNFNKELFVDFMGAQIKTLSFLAYIVRIFQETVLTHSSSVTNGMLGLMQLCPKEAAHLRKELLIAARHIFATELRQKFIPVIEKLFDEDLLIGKGVTLESIRPLAYSTLADLTHHVRQHLTLDVLEKAVNLFSKNVHDESLATGIQTMSCKLLLNLVHCIRQHSEVEPVKARTILTTLLKVFAYKFKTIAKIHLPLLIQRWKVQCSVANSSTTNNTAVGFDVKDGVGDNVPSEPFPKNFMGCNQWIYSVNNIAEYRSLVKTLVGGVKTVTWGFISSKPLNPDVKLNQEKLFKSDELCLYINLIYWAMDALDIYTLNAPNVAQQRTSGQIPRSKEEKEVLEHFSGIFLMMHPQNFQEVFATTISFMVERIYKNPSLQVIANSFLANTTTSPLFATVLVEYLLGKMSEMGSNIDRSNLYLRLFKLVFGSVSLFPAENEQMLRPHLHNIVNRSMDLALTATEPYNYFLLLRALFRSIGGGSHDLLYQEFLPLLPNLLEGLNRLQSGFHKQHMKDLFVELCLTVPVRLSSLLPYLPMLMDPLVSALNGSPTLISQGLRTLELCVDNLQPDFLYDHIQPVRAALMQALWKTLRSQDSAATVAFRVLGKFGGGNRKMMVEPQNLHYQNSEAQSTAIITYFQDHENPINFPIDKAIEAAFNALSANTTDSFYRRQSWELIRCFLAASISLDDEKHTLQKFFMHPSFIESSVVTWPIIQNKFEESQVRKTHQIGLTGMLVASATKDLRECVFPVMVAVVRHYTMVAIAQQAGPFPYKYYHEYNGIDPMVLVDALAVCMGHEEKELCKPGQLCIRLILDTATNIMGNKERACRLPIIQYLAEKLTSLCYERPWYAKVGGCKSIQLLYQHMSIKALYQHLFTFLKAFLFVLMDLEGEVSSGAIDIAKNSLKNMLEVCMVPLNSEASKELTTLQAKASYEVIHELVRHITSPNTLVREESIATLKFIAQIQKRTVFEIMEPHKDVLADIIPPKKHLLRHQPANAQIGLMEGNTFCTTLEPRLFTIDLSDSYHKLFFHELLTLSDAEDSTLTKLDCYKNVTNLIPLRKSALRALAACHYIKDNEYKEKIINILFKVLESNKPDLQEEAYKCMKQFICGVQIDKEKVQSVIRPLLLSLGDHRNLSLSATKRLSFFTRLFPQMFNEKLSEQILQHSQKILEISVTSYKCLNQGGNFFAVAKGSEYEQKVVTLIEMFHQITAASPKYIESLCRLVLQTERSLMVEMSSPYREPLLKFFLRFANETVEMFLSDAYIINPQWNRFFIYILKHPDGQPFRAVIKSKKYQVLIKFINCKYNNDVIIESGHQFEAQQQAIMIIYTLMKSDEQWITTQTDIIAALKRLWQNELYQSCQVNVACNMWHLVGKILLTFFRHNTNEIDLLFQLLRALSLHFVPDFNFLRDFLLNTVAQSFTVYWKRKVFFHFVENFNNPDISEELKAKIITSVLIPCFIVSFDKGEGNKLIGTSPAPYEENENNIVSVFISKVFDPDKPFANDDAVRIALLQFACLLVERASQHIHDGDANNKRQGSKLRRLMTFAWPCLLSKNSVDPTARYHGHLLLAHIISRLAIHKKIVLQVFHSLLKGHALEARPVVRQALDVLTPAMPLRMEDGNTMLTHWTKKIIVEEGHAMQQLFHILQLIVRHYKVYFPVRHQLVQHLINYMQRLGFPPNASLEQRKLSVDLAEVIIKWELQRIRDDERDGKCNMNGEERDAKNEKPEFATKRPSSDEMTETRKKGPTTHAQNTKYTDMFRSLDKSHCDTVLNFLIRLACQVNDVQTGVISAGESLSRRCIMLLKMAMRPEVWPQPFELKLTWLDKVLSTIESPHCNLNNICTGLDFLTFLTTILKSDQLLTILRSLQRGLSTCIINQNTRVVRLMHVLISRLMAIFPPDSHHKHEDLDLLYNSISKMIVDNLNIYEKSAQSNPSSLFGTLMILKACCTSNPSYIDRLMLQFIRVLNRLTKDHLNIQSCQSNTSTMEGTHLAVELLVVSLDLLKSRIQVMGVDVRKLFIGSVLVSLIEKSMEVKVLKCIVKMVDDWIRTKDQNLMTMVPSIREKSILLVKLMQYVEKKFPDEVELNIQYLEMIHYIYRDEYLKQTELTAKLEGAYLSGLRSQNSYIRAKFFEILDASMRRRLHDRLLYIICSQAWDSIGTHYWIKQCIELLILTSNTLLQIQNSNDIHKIPSITSVINLADSQDKNKFVVYTSSQVEYSDPVQNLCEKEDVFENYLNNDVNIARQEDTDNISATREEEIVKLINRQIEFLEANRKIRTEQLLIATSQLCHMDLELAESVWLSIFPRIWNIFDENQQHSILRELIPFLSSGTNVIQKDCYPSAINTFVESLTLCNPRIYIPPNLMTYLGKAHNLWHRMTLMLEEMTFKNTLPDSELCNEVNIKKSHVNNALSQMYSAMCEEDLWAGLWLKYAQYAETNVAIAYEQMGFFEEAQGAYDIAMSKYKQDSTNGLGKIDINSEVHLWEDHWIRCTKELNQWDILLDYAQTNKEKNMFLILESAWRVPDWNLMKSALIKTEQSVPKKYCYKLNLYKGFIAILHHEERQLANVERYVELASASCMREWRRLPHIISHIHLQYLQAAQQIMELHEASQIHQGLIQSRSSSLHDMKAIVKTWRNRLPVIGDDLSHWSDIFTWRQHHYQIITQFLEQQSDQGNTMLGVHASAQAIIYFGKIARKQNLTSVCQETLSRIYTIPSVPIVDCFQKIRQQVKCYLQMASTIGRNELNEALEVIESTNLKYFTGEMNAEFYALKGLLLSQIGRTEEAGKAFSAAVQLHDGLTKAWALWGDYMEQMFLREKQMVLAVSALTCFLQSCRHQNESKTRKYLAKVLWLLSYDNADGNLMNTFEKYVVGVPPSYWLPWIPQLLCFLLQCDGNVILNLISHVGRLYPQAVYFPTRTLYLTLKIEQREKHKSEEQAAGKSNILVSEHQSFTNNPQGGSVNTIKATRSMWRCSKVMHVQREIHPTILTSLESIVDQMVWFRESWTEEVLRQLRQGLVKCYSLAFENRNAVNESTITPHTLHFVKKLGSTFGIGIENIQGSVTSSISNSAASESLARRAQVTFQDPVFQKMKEQFTSDFDFSKPGAMKLHNLIAKLKTWIKSLEIKVKKLPTSFLIEDKCRFLSNFSQKTAEVELPGELLIPSSAHYHIRISRFMPRVEIVQKNNTAARRLYIRGTNGRIYPYLVVIDTGLGDARREERVLQLMRMLNLYLDKQKETTRRFLHMTVPRVVPISPQMRLAEDNPSSVSLREIYKNCCLKLKMDHELPIVKYYERLSEVQSRGTQTNHTVMCDIYIEVQNKMVPRTLFKEWAYKTFLSATDYWHFRKMLTLQFSLSFLCEYALYLTRLNADMIYLHQNSGLMNVSYFKFDISDDKDELESSRPVPFRLTPNIAEFITSIGINGPLSAAIVATARCFVQPSYKICSILRAILRDEIIALHKKRIRDSKLMDTAEDGNTDGNIMENIISMVNRVVSAMMARLNGISYFDNMETKKVNSLIYAATNPDNLCRMDPAWHPWL